MTFSKKITVTDKRQITLPVELCRELGIEEGEELEISNESGKIRLEPVLEEKAVGECTGFLGTIGEAEADMESDQKSHDEVLAEEADPRTKS